MPVKFIEFCRYKYFAKLFITQRFTYLLLIYFVNLILDYIVKFKIEKVLKKKFLFTDHNFAPLLMSVYFQLSLNTDQVLIFHCIQLPAARNPQFVVVSYLHFLRENVFSN